MPSKPLTSQRILKAALWGFLALSLIRVWAAPGLLQRAEAQIPDAGLQRKQLLDEMQRANQLLGEIKALLAEGTLNVKVKGADNQAGPG
jgi:hypothetical protein